MKVWFTAIWAEIRRGFRSFWTYRANVFTGLLSMYVIFMGFSLLLGRGELNPNEMAYGLLGYVAWLFVSEVLGNIGRGLRGAATAGTLEQMCLSPAPLGIVLTGRTIAHLATSAAMLGTFTLVLNRLSGVPLPMNWRGVPVALLTVLGVYGFGYIVGGVVLLYRQMESFTFFLSNVMLFLNGTLLPVALMPSWMAPVARMMPSTQGVIVLQRVVLEGQTLRQAWADGSLMWLTIHSLAFLVVGYAVFMLCEQKAKGNGSLGQY